MCLFDDFIVWKTTQLQKDVEVHVHQHHRAELTRTFCDELTYQHYHFTPATNDVLPLKWQAGRAMRMNACEARTWNARCVSSWGGGMAHSVCNVRK